MMNAIDEAAGVGAPRAVASEFAADLRIPPPMSGWPSRACAGALTAPDAPCSSDTLAASALS
ncbi:hypothetical protein [Mycobacterium sp.]|uniref:hypothetical protein n=1 Tax=Mycobacterium sp. TaxID=1785 RepID=UPI002C94B909|nr:hypothetical protein [Mycobacterium sp.]